MDYFALNFKKEYISLLKLKNEYSFKNSVIESFIVALITLITLLLSFLFDEALSHLLPSLKIYKNQPHKKIVEHNYFVKENPKKISLLKELNFCKSFYTPA